MIYVLINIHIPEASNVTYMYANMHTNKQTHMHNYIHKQLIDLTWTVNNIPLDILKIQSYVSYVIEHSTSKTFFCNFFHRKIKL